jgi:16S rRNA (cytosine1402-N4)-methyltransferase
LIPLQGNFGNLQAIINNHFNQETKLDGILFDIGLSSNQIEDATRGFSFKRNGPLDMRMNSKGNMTSVDGISITAEAIVNNFSHTQLSDIIFKYGEERQSKKIATAIEKARNKLPITTTEQLADIIANSVGMGNSWYYSKQHPATKTFQALRIYVNDELNQLYKGLINAEHMLKPDGKLLVVSFHSLEDRLVKRFQTSCLNRVVETDTIDQRIKANPSFYRRLRRAAHDKDEKWERDSSSDQGFLTALETIDDELVVEEEEMIHGSFKPMTKRVVKPTEEEIEANPRSRSAKLRALRRTKQEPVHELDN